MKVKMANTSSMKKSLFNRSNLSAVIFALIAMALIAYSFQRGIAAHMDGVVAEPIEDHTWAIAVALSDKAYGLNEGYVFYTAVFDALNKGGMTKYPQYLENFSHKFPENLRDPTLLNQAISKAMHLFVPKNPQLEHYEISPMPYTDIGLVYYIKDAFSIFGYKVQSAYYFYFLLLTAGIAIFMFAHWREPILLSIPIIFLCLLTTMVKYIEANGDINLATVHNHRFLSTLAIIPGLHIVLQLIRQRAPSTKHVVAITLQSILLVYLVLVRSSAVWEIIAIGIVSAFLLIRTYYIRPSAFIVYLRSYTPLLYVLVPYFIILRLSEKIKLLQGKEMDAWAQHAYPTSYINNRKVAYNEFLLIGISIIALYLIFTHRTKIMHCIRTALRTKGWPAIIVLALFIGWKLPQTWLLHPLYFTGDAIPHHMKYHNAFLGLSQHPRLYDLYTDELKGGLDDNMHGDGFGYNASFRELVKENAAKGITFTSGNFVTGYTKTLKMGLHDEYVGKAYINFVKRHPWFVLETHFYKLQNSWNLWYNTMSQSRPFRILLLLSCIGALVLASPRMAKRMNPMMQQYALQTGLTSLIMGVCVLMPVIYAYPSPIVFADQFMVLSFTAIMLPILAALGWVTWQERRKSPHNH